MESSPLAHPQVDGTMDINLRNRITDAIRYWEPRRIAYNVVLVGVVLGCLVVAQPESRQVLTLDLLLFGFVLAVLANVAYCAAYVVDIFVQSSSLRQRWLAYRWILLAIGVAFAGVITRGFTLGLIFRAH